MISFLLSLYCVPVYLQICLKFCQCCFLVITFCASLSFEKQTIVFFLCLDCTSFTLMLFTVPYSSIVLFSFWVFRFSLYLMKILSLLSQTYFVSSCTTDIACSFILYSCLVVFSLLFSSVSVSIELVFVLSLNWFPFLVAESFICFSAFYSMSTDFCFCSLSLHFCFVTYHCSVLVPPFC